MQKITPHLWFDKEAREAAELYTSTFRDSRIKKISTIQNTPSGTVDIVSVELCGQAFILLSAGPYFRFTPSISFLVGCDSKDEVDEFWGKLSPGGSALMELGAYPFSERYAWIQDRYGLSWQVMYMGDREFTQRIIPTLMFAGEQCGKAEEAIGFYTSIFHDASTGHVLRYEKGEDPDKEGTIKHAGFVLEASAFAAMDSARVHGFTFTEAISFIVNCRTQEEIDYYWPKLSAVPSAEQCGWLKDRFGISWQIVPTILNELMSDKDPKKVARVSQAFLAMKKFDIAALQSAYAGR